LFDGTVCYEIPSLQRPYVWNEQDQWQPLWGDIERVAGAVQLVTQEHGDEDDAETLMELLAISAKRFRGTPKRFKLWPSRIDRPPFEHVIDNELKVSEDLAESRIAGRVVSRPRRRQMD
jgi:hypothetical protein